MTENEFLLQDRIAKIKSINEQYDLLNNSYISFSGGKDSNVLSKLIDVALPENNIPRVYADTGIELTAVRDFVKEKAQTDNRIKIIKPSVSIKKMLEEYGYPFKSKRHAKNVELYQKSGMTKWVKAYLGLETTQAGVMAYRPCPKILKYQFTEENKLKISDKCCFYLKEQPLKNWQKENNKKIAIIGLMAAEGGGELLPNALMTLVEGNIVSNLWFH